MRWMEGFPDYMETWNDFLNSILVTTLLAWFVAQSLKVILVFFTKKRLDFSRFVGSGGMPSSHSAFAVSLAVAIGLTDGFSSNSFAVSFVLALVVMYDASGIRRAAGQQAKILNKMVENWKIETGEVREKQLKELLGHTPYEVFAGAILGAVIALARHG